MDTKALQIEPDEKLVPIMLYTQQKLIWGKLITKKVVRVSKLLQMDMAPKCLDLVEAQAILFGAGSETKSLKFEALHVDIDQIIAYHILPPEDESPYYEEHEENRIMEPVIAIVGIFQFNGFLRIAEQSDIKSYLGVQKGTYLPIYDSKMTCPLIPKIKGLQSPYTLVDQRVTIFSETGH
jgi:hypothetical protein